MFNKHLEGHGVSYRDHQKLAFFFARESLKASFMAFVHSSNLTCAFCLRVLECFLHHHHLLSRSCCVCTIIPRQPFFLCK